MHNLSFAVMGKPPAYRYHLLRNALEAFQKNLPHLDEKEFNRVCQRADRSFHLETLALSSPEASQIVILPERVDMALQEIADRYPDDNDFTSDLSQNGLTPDTLRQALQRELLFDGILQKIASRSITINDIDIQLYYEMNRGRFTQPETRLVRQILITVNDAYPENQYDTVVQRIRSIAAQATGNAKQFGKLARQYSECPTAMEGGKLGNLPRGQLYPQLDAALFTLSAGQVSAPIESELGFHLLLCEHIYPPQQVSLTKARPQIRTLLEERAQRNCQKAWLKQLEASVTPEVSP
jgi:peptidyl-prolyl cis-trans isomerase C